MSLIRDTLYGAGTSIASVLGRLALTVVLARELEPSAYGEFALLQWGIDLSALIFSAGLTGSLGRFLPILAKTPRDLLTGKARSLTMASGVSIAAIVASFLLYILFTGHFTPWEILALSAWCLSSALLLFFRAALQGLFLYDTMMLGTLATVILAPVLASFLIVSPSLANAALAFTAANVAGLAVSIHHSRRERKTAPPHPSDGQGTAIDNRAIIRFSANVWVTALLAGLVWSRGEFAILKFYLSNADIAIYSVALSLTGAVPLVGTLFTSAQLPHIARRVHQGDEDGTFPVVATTTQYALLAVSTISIGMIGLGPALIGLVFGAKYAASYDIMSILVIGMVAAAAASANGLLLIKTNGSFGLHSNLVSLALLFITAMLLTPKFGLVGTAVARTLTQLSAGAYSFVYLYYSAKDKTAALRLLTGFVFAVAYIVVYFLFVRIYSPHGLALYLPTVATLVLGPMAIIKLVGQPFRLPAKLVQFLENVRWA